LDHAAARARGRGAVWAGRGRPERRGDAGRDARPARGGRDRARHAGRAAPALAQRARGVVVLDDHRRGGGHRGRRDDRRGGRLVLGPAEPGAGQPGPGRDRGGAAMKRSFLVALTALLTACTGELTELLVVVDSDLAVPSELDSVRVTTESMSAAGALTNVSPLPRTVGIVHRGGESY